MKFQIWCIAHDEVVHGDDYAVTRVDDDFEIDEAHLYCRGVGFGHEFWFKIPASEKGKVIIEEPAPKYDPKVNYGQKLVDEGIATKTDTGIKFGKSDPNWSANEL